MEQPQRLKSGQAAPESGMYVTCDPFGIATSQTAHVRKDQILPRTSLGFFWRLLQSTREQVDTHGMPSKPPRGFGNVGHPC
jgi:hypothetical protein